MAIVVCMYHANSSKRIFTLASQISILNYVLVSQQSVLKTCKHHLPQVLKLCLMVLFTPWLRDEFKNTSLRISPILCPAANRLESALWHHQTKPFPSLPCPPAQLKPFITCPLFQSCAKKKPQCVITTRP